MMQVPVPQHLGSSVMVTPQVVELTKRETVVDYPAIYKF
jgi:hypothetical protein